MPRDNEPNYVMGNEHRVKIRNSNILNALIEHTEGKRKMLPTQVTAGLGLLRKVLPDLAQHEITGKDGGPLKVELVRFADDGDENGSS